MSKKTEYHEYINSPEWKAIRVRAFAIHGRWCHKCDARTNLHIHHKTYKRFKKEDVQLDLVPLCESCHDKCHLFCKRNRFDIWHGTEQFLLGENITKKEFKRRLKKSKLTRKQRRALRKKQRLLNPVIGPVWRSAPVPFEEQQKRLSSSSRALGESELNRRISENKKAGVNINLQKFMDMYGIDEETARSFL